MERRICHLLRHLRPHEKNSPSSYAGSSGTLCQLACSASSKKDENVVEMRKERVKGHSVPKSMKSSKGSATEFLQPDVPKPTLAEKARTLLHGVHTGVLATIHAESGYPYASLINISVLDSRVFTFISKLAEHTANAKSDSRASILISQVQGKGDQLATARATLLGKFVQVEKTEELIQQFLKVHPAAYYVNFDDFLCFAMDLERVRLISGFGSMVWIAGNDFAEAKVDFVSLHSESALNHMNDSHQDDVLSMAKAFSGLPQSKRATLLSIDCYGMEVLVELPDGKRRSRITFPKRLDSPDEIKENVIALTRKAREILKN